MASRFHAQELISNMGDVFAIPLGDDDEIEWQLKWCGFEFGVASRFVEQRRVQRWTIPYLPLVLPLALLSAWLILVKPRPAKSAKESMPQAVHRAANDETLANRMP